MKVFLYLCAILGISQFETKKTRTRSSPPVDIAPVEGVPAELPGPSQAVWRVHTEHKFNRNEKKHFRDAFKPKKADSKSFGTETHITGVL
jgi:hypothetical protein